MSEKSKDDWLKGVPEELADILRGGTVVATERFVPAEQLPPQFSYPASYKRFVEQHPVKISGLGSWGYASGLREESEHYSRVFNRPLVLFAQAYGMTWLLASIADTSNPRVIVLNPWSTPNPLVVAEIDNFDGWMLWARQDAMREGSYRARVIE
jgi:hypothetical protein